MTFDLNKVHCIDALDGVPVKERRAGQGSLLNLFENSP